MDITKSPLFEMIQQQEDTNTSLYKPKTLSAFFGQEKLKQKLHLYIQAARVRKEPLDHLLLFGPPGLGKTTLATIISQELNTDIRTCSGPMLDRTGDLVAILSGLKERDILFIDEIHRLPITIEEVLYSAMEQFKVDVILGQGIGAKTITIPLAPFTLIGATTKSGMLSAPLRSRFGIQERLDFYTREELSELITVYAKTLSYELEKEAALIIAACARGTPRVAKKLFLRIRDFAQVKNNTIITPQVTHDALDLLDINPLGLTPVDLDFLRILKEHAPHPVGLDTLACLLGEDAQTLEEVYEPFLLRSGYIEKTPRGRIIAPVYDQKKIFNL